MMNLLDNTTNQPSKFRAKNWVGINGDSSGRYNTNSQIKFKSSMTRSSLCNYSDAYILSKGTITVTNTEAELVALNNRSKKVTFRIVLHLLIASVK